MIYDLHAGRWNAMVRQLEEALLYEVQQLQRKHDEHAPTTSQVLPLLTNAGAVIS